MPIVWPPSHNLGLPGEVNGSLIWLLIFSLDWRFVLVKRKFIHRYGTEGTEPRAVLVLLKTPPLMPFLGRVARARLKPMQISSTEDKRALHCDATGKPCLVDPRRFRWERVMKGNWCQLRGTSRIKGKKGRAIGESCLVCARDTDRSL
jgi:hypothetical protein